jgi:hypothetical protein
MPRAKPMPLGATGAIPFWPWGTQGYGRATGRYTGATR